MARSFIAPLWGFLLAGAALLPVPAVLSQETGGIVKLVQRGAYVAEFQISFEVPVKGKFVRKGVSWKKATVGQSKSFDLPAGSRNVRVRGEAFVFINTKRGIFEKFFASAPRVEITVTGTTLDRRFSVKDLGVAPAAVAKTFDYTVSIHTGPVEGADTNSGIFIRLTGTKGESPEIRLNALIKGDGLKRGGNGVAVLKLAKDIGVVTQVAVRSDMKGSDADWYLHYLGVRSPGSGGDTYDFNSWFKDTKTQTRRRSVR